jgi:hypothetical protein
LEFNGANWQAAAPSSFFRGVSVRLAYDARNRRIVQFSSMLDVFQLAPGTWFYDPPVAPTWTRYGAGCAGSNGTPTLDAAPGSVPALGSTFVLQLGSLPLQPGFALLAFGLDVVRWNSALLPVLLDPLGLPGCKAWIAPSADVLVGHGGAAASFAFAIPANPALTGLLVAAQAIVFDPAAAGGVGSVTNGGILSVR